MSRDNDINVHYLQCGESAGNFIAQRKAIENVLPYWIGIAECDCTDEHPNGGCLKCDLERVQWHLDSLHNGA